MAKRKNKQNNFLAVGIVIAIVLIAFNFYSTFQIKKLQQEQQENIPMMGNPMSQMSFSEFDKQKATEFMDKNNDGKCDICGMPIEQCIASGMMQCSGMDPDATIGVLGSQHIHADWKIYLDGKEFDWSPYADRHHKQMMGDKSITDTSAFMHIHPAEGQEKGGDVMHMHATGISLSLFFESLGMQFDKGCLNVNEKEYCGVKMYVNGEENAEFGNYVFNDLDKILITDGGNIEEQMKSITNFAETH